MLPKEEKAAIRAEAIERRDSIPGPVRHAKNAAIIERLVADPEYTAARSVLFYASFRSEVDTAGAIERALLDGKKVFVTKVEGEDCHLDIYRIKGLDDLSPGYMGIPEPVAGVDAKASLGDVELVVIPGVAFDSAGRRLGYGKGCYDRLLGGGEAAERPRILALAFQEQMVGHVPALSYDVPINKIITDRSVINCNGQSQD